jgi:hypothetical protein
MRRREPPSATLRPPCSRQPCAAGAAALHSSPSSATRRPGCCWPRFPLGPVCHAPPELPPASPTSATAPGPTRRFRPTRIERHFSRTRPRPRARCRRQPISQPSVVAPLLQITTGPSLLIMLTAPMPLLAAGLGQPHRSRAPPPPRPPSHHRTTACVPRRHSMSAAVSLARCGRASADLCVLAEAIP